MTTLNTNQTQVKSPVHHETFCKAPTVSEEKIQKMVDLYQVTEEVANLFYKAVNWILVNDNKKSSMKFFKSYQPLVDARLAETFEFEGDLHLRLSNKGNRIVRGYVPKIKVDQQPRVKVVQSKGYHATAEITEQVQNFLDRIEYTVKRSKLLKAYYTIWLNDGKSRRVIETWLYENDVKFVFFGPNKQAVYDKLLANLGDMVVDKKMAFSYGFIHIKKADLDNITKDMFNLDELN